MGYSVFSGIRRLHLVDLSSDDAVASSSSHTVTLTPGVGEIYEVLHVYVAIPAIAGSSGDHELECFQKFGSSDRSHWYMKNPGTSSMFVHRHILWATTTKSPPNEVSQVLLFTPRSLFCSQEYPLKFKYTNGTDTNQTGTRTIEVLVGVRSG